MASSSLFGSDSLSGSGRGSPRGGGSDLASDASDSPRASTGDTSSDPGLKSTIKIAMVQLNPFHKQPDKTLRHLNDMLASCFPSFCPDSSNDPLTTASTPPTIDILMLPEMALTGYTFTSPQDIHPYAEPADPSGRTTAWCMRTARQLGCWVVAGFPCYHARSDKYYNAMVLVNRHGHVVTTYFKHFLYTQDELWATPGPSFKALASIPEFGTLGLGICMDLNPYRFEAPFDLCEFGRFCVSKQTRLVLCCMAWLRSKPDNDHQQEWEDEEDEDESAHEAHSLLSYWAYRLRPLDGTGCLVAICNRVGKETAAAGPEQQGQASAHGETKHTEFAGHSCVMQLSGGPKAREMEVTHVGRKEGVYVIEAEFDWAEATQEQQWPVSQADEDPAFLKD